MYDTNLPDLYTSADSSPIQRPGYRVPRAGYRFAAPPAASTMYTASTAWGQASITLRPHCAFKLALAGHLRRGVVNLRNILRLTKSALGTSSPSCCGLRSFQLGLGFYIGQIASLTGPPIHHGGIHEISTLHPLFLCRTSRFFRLGYR